MGLARISNVDSVLLVMLYRVAFDASDGLRQQVEPTSLVVFDVVFAHKPSAMEEDNAIIVVLDDVGFDLQQVLTLDYENAFLLTLLDLVELNFAVGASLPTEGYVGFYVLQNIVTRDLSRGPLFKQDSLVVVLHDRIALWNFACDVLQDVVFELSSCFEYFVEPHR